MKAEISARKIVVIVVDTDDFRPMKTPGSTVCYRTY